MLKNADWVSSFTDRTWCLLVLRSSLPFVLADRMAGRIFSDDGVGDDILYVMGLEIGLLHHLITYLAY